MSKTHVASDRSLSQSVHLSTAWDFDCHDAGWERQSDGPWQSFYDYWRGQDFEDTFKSQIMTLAHESLRIDLGKRARGDTNGRILVRDSYRDLFSRVCAFEKKYHNRFAGVLVTGQPGTGKTTWLWFALVCLLSKGENVVFSIDVDAFLFYGGCVYMKARESPRLPNVRQIWRLVDECRPPAFLMGGFVVQSSSPERYGSWIDKRKAGVFGMPLWSEAEIYRGYRLQVEYTPLFGELSSAFKSRDPEKLSDMEGLQGMESLQKIVLEEWTNVADSDFSGDPKEWADRVIDALLRHLVEWYGGVPREVYNALSGLGIPADMIDYSLKYVNPSELLRCLRVHLSERTTSVPYTPIILWPKQDGISLHDTFISKFRSDAVGRRIIDSFGDIPPGHLSFLIASVYHHTPPSSILSRWILESYAHAAFSTSPSLQGSLRAMVRADASNPHTYKLSNRSVSPTSMPFRRRQIVTIKLDNGQLTWPPRLGDTLTLEDCFFVLKLRDNALFDSFYVDFEEDSTKPIVWIIRATAEPVHRNTSADYSLILSIKDMAERRADEREKELVSAGKLLMTSRKRKRGASSTRSRATQAEMKYVLAASLPEQEHTWEMPPSCPTLLLGKVFCHFIEVPDASRLDYLL